MARLAGGVVPGAGGGEAGGVAGAVECADLAGASGIFAGGVTEIPGLEVWDCAAGQDGVAGERA